MSALAIPGRRMLLATALLLAVSASVLGADWVYDDLHMVGNPAMDAPDDVAATFGRTSADYLSSARSGGTATHTWRPLTMLTLVATHVAMPRPLAHHVVSWLLHAAAVLVLLSWDRRRATAWTAAVAVFAVHPALGEAWLYINGRSDLVAGLCLVGLWCSTLARGRVAWVTCALFAVAGVLAKETFVCAAPFVLLARFRPASRQARAVLAAGALGLLVAIVLGASLRSDLGAAGSVARLLSPRIAGRWPALLGLATETFLVPLPRPMRSLAHELGPAALAHLPALLACALAGAWIVHRRAWRAALHLLGAMAVVLPTALVSDVFWLGFERYLYMPAVLLVTACAPQLRAVRLDRRIALGATCAAVVLAIMTALGARQFASHAAFGDALVEGRPDDPAGYLIAASTRARRGDLEGAFALLERMPTEQLTGATAHEAAWMLHRLGRPDLVAIVIEDAHRRDPGDAYVRLDLLGLRAAQGRYDEALRIAETLRDEPGFCAAVREQLQPWALTPAIPREVQQRAAVLARPCQ